MKWPHFLFFALKIHTEINLKKDVRVCRNQIAFLHKENVVCSRSKTRLRKVWICEIWQYGLWSFQMGGMYLYYTKLEILLPRIKILIGNYWIWRINLMEEVSKILKVLPLSLTTNKFSGSFGCPCKISLGYQISKENTKQTSFV